MISRQDPWRLTSPYPRYLSITYFTKDFVGIVWCSVEKCIDEVATRLNRYDLKLFIASGQWYEAPTTSTSLRMSIILPVAFVLCAVSSASSESQASSCTPHLRTRDINVKNRQREMLSEFFHSVALGFTLRDFIEVFHKNQIESIW